MIKTITTKAYQDQKTGTAGLRKKTRVAMQENYIENFVQAIYNALGGVEGKTFILGGDGRFFNDECVQKVIKMSVANGVKKLIIGQNGYLSTPAASNIILKNKTDGGIVLSSSHNPGGIDADFGIKFAGSSGGQIPDSLTNKIYEITKTITEYKTIEDTDFNTSKIGTFNYNGMEIEVIDPVTDYVVMMQEIFDFPAIKKLFADGFSFVFDGMNAISGPYAIEIFENILGAKKGSVINAVPLPDFGGLHPEPNLIYAKPLVDLMYSDNAPDFGAANDGDADRNLILGRKCFVSPSDSLAVLTKYHNLIPAYKNGINGVAKSMPSSSAVVRVAEDLGLPWYETPTGWKYFVNLMDSKRITFCGEESFGTSSDHIREKDGIWAVLFWLNIIAATGKTVAEIMQDFFETYGRSYYLLKFYEAVDLDIANKMMEDLKNKLPSLSGNVYGSYTVKNACEFTYNDPVDGSSTTNGMNIYFTDGSRIVTRLSGTGTVGATIRLYLEKYEKEKINEDPNKMLEELTSVALEILEIPQRTGRTEPDVTT
ncbi:MAG: alpha-D-glucose phosphate-specific phosphoglucomutase [Alphaproteobacteria bacterium]